MVLVVVEIMWVVILFAVRWSKLKELSATFGRIAECSLLVPKDLPLEVSLNPLTLLGGIRPADGTRQVLWLTAGGWETRFVPRAKLFYKA